MGGIIPDHMLKDSVNFKGETDVKNEPTIIKKITDLVNSDEHVRFIKEIIDLIKREKRKRRIKKQKIEIIKTEKEKFKKIKQ